MEGKEDEDKWLTCILFPQQGPQTAYEGEDEELHVHYELHYQKRNVK